MANFQHEVVIRVKFKTTRKARSRVSVLRMALSILRNSGKDYDEIYEFDSGHRGVTKMNGEVEEDE